jgi:3-dehydroquinate dehydratase II
VKIAIINGPNLNLLGKREPGIYGDKTFEEFFDEIVQGYPADKFYYFQSNIEGDLINKIQESGMSCEGIIINAGGYTHTSVAIADAIAAIKIPAIEVHISNIFTREDFRHVSYLGKYCRGSISGMGLLGYELAIQALHKIGI